MPNYCENSVKITAPNDELFKKLEEANYKSFMSSFKPTPEDLDNELAHCWGGDKAEEQNAIRAELKTKYNYENGNDWRIGEWGTKWDFGIEEFELSSDTRTLFIPYFDTAWSPPIEFYDFLYELGYEVKAYYYEPGCGFCGRYDEDGDTSFDINGGSDWIRKNIPSDIDEEFSISDNMVEWEEEEAEEQREDDITN